MKILITCGGGFQGQTLLADLRFLEDAEIHLCDTNAVHGSLFCADFCVVCPKIMESDAYSAFILEYTANNKINLVIPATAHDLLLLSGLKKVLLKNDCKVLVPDIDVLKILNYKVSAYAFLRVNDIPVQDQLLYDNADSYPLIAKPNNGWGSRKIFRFRTINEMRENFRGIPEEYSWTQMHTEIEEYSCDFAIGPEGNSGECVYRVRERISGGFAIQALILDEPPAAVRAIGDKVIALFSKPEYSGIYNVQIIATPGETFVSDVNCRIGTSAVASIFFGKSLLSKICGDTNKFELNNEVRFIRSLKTTFFPAVRLDGVSHIVFDLDDTLISHRKWIQRRSELLYLSSDVLMNSITLEEYNQWIDWQLTEGKASSLIDIIFQKFRPFAKKSILLEKYRDCYPDTLDVYRDVLPTLKQLYERGYSLSLLTDNPIKTQRVKWSIFPGREYFRNVLYTSELNTEKPDKITFHRICAMSLKEPRDSVMVGNNLFRDIKGSLEADYRFAFHIRRSDDLLAQNSYDQRAYSNAISINTLKELLYYFKKPTTAKYDTI